MKDTQTDDAAQVPRLVRAYRFRLDPTPAQQKQLREIFGQVRYVYNAALSQRIMYWERGRKRITEYDQMKELTVALKDPELNWLRQAPRMALNASIQNLERGYSAAFRRFKRGERPIGFPRYHGRHKNQGFKFFTSVTIDPGPSGKSQFVRLPKVGAVEIHWQHGNRGYPPTGKIKIQSGSVTYDGRWWCSIAVAREPIEYESLCETVYVHLGLKNLAYLLIDYGSGREERRTLNVSDEVVITDLRAGRRRMAQKEADKVLARLQRSLSRRKPGSKRREKQKEKIKLFHMDIGDSRERNLHVVSNQIIALSPRRIVIQRWDVKGMLRQKKYSKKIAEASWSELSRQIEYKAKWRGMEFESLPADLKVSKTCSQCGVVDERFPLGKPIYECAACGMTKDRERNALDNLKKSATAPT